jgi:hypothetical protein
MAGRRASVIRGILSLILLGAAAWVFFHRQQVLDQLVVWQYKPPASVASLATRAQFSDSGKYLFYASQPNLSDKDHFNKHCDSHEAESVVLGCYVAQRIYIYNVTDKRLDGVKEVTAAHEMLHAAYERLSGDERKRVNGLVEKEVARNPDKKLTARLKTYERTEPGERDNELHSILGTERGRLGSELEAYYAQYFKSRSAVARLFTKYEDMFRQLETQQNTLVKELNAIAKELKTRSGAYNKEIAKLNAAIDTFNARADTSGGFTTEADFKAARNKLVDEQHDLENKRTSLNKRIAEYNTKRTKLESLNLHAKDLQSSLNSKPAPVPAL